jgi:hypothetical protein
MRRVKICPHSGVENAINAPPCPHLLVTRVCPVAGKKNGDKPFFSNHPSSGKLKSLSLRKAETVVKAVSDAIAEVCFGQGGVCMF